MSALLQFLTRKADLDDVTLVCFLAAIAVFHFLGGLS